MDNTLKAKPTIYKGISFRSRLEARAAAAFDRQGWRWLYETDTYVAGHNGYIPDFKVSIQYGETVWIEVKPNMEMIDDDHKARQFAMSVDAPVYYGYEGQSVLHRPDDVWEPEVWTSPLHLLLIDPFAREIRQERTIPLPQYQDGKMIWPSDE